MKVTHVKTYLLEHNGEIYTPNLKINQRGFYQEELEKVLKDNNFKNYNIICIEEEVAKYNLCDSTCNCYGLDEEVFQYKLWNEAYLDNNLNGFSLPIIVNTNNEYRKEVEQKLLEYVKYLERPAFVYERSTLECIKIECRLILKAIDHLIHGNENNAEKIIEQLLSLFIEDPFLISDLDKSYSFRGIAPFIDLRSVGYDEDYDKMMEMNLTFYRVRTRKVDDNENITDIEHILHLPYNLKDKASSMRFSSAALPGLYLGTTTYVCSEECKWNGEDELYASVFIPNSEGKKLKILNMTISQALINGIYNRTHDGNNIVRRKLQNAMLKMFPLVIATSFSVKIEEKVKYQYLLSQALMRCASRIGIDGIAYLSMKGKDEFQYPQGVNLAIPATDISEKNLYSEKCKGFMISKPVMYCRQEGKERRSYINEVYKKQDEKGFESYISKLNMGGELKFYGDTSFGKFDDYLVSEVVRNE